MQLEETAPIRIALAEDEADLRNVYVRLIERLGHRVVLAAADGAELVDQCVNVHVDLVLVDLDMPVMDGLAAAEIIAAKGIPVVLISGHPDASEVVLEQEPVVARIMKPATAETLQKAIEKAMAFRR